MKLSNLILLVILLGISCLIFACREGCYVSFDHTSDGVPLVHFKEHSWSTKDSINITMVEVYHVADRREKPVWAIRTPDISKPIQISTITYGVLPSGFEELRKPQPLVSGETYEVWVVRPGMICKGTFIYSGK